MQYAQQIKYPQLPHDFFRIDADIPAPHRIKEHHNTGSILTCFQAGLEREKVDVLELDQLFECRVYSVEFRVVNRES